MAVAAMTLPVFAQPTNTSSTEDNGGHPVGGLPPDPRKDKDDEGSTVKLEEPTVTENILYQMIVIINTL